MEKFNQEANGYSKKEVNQFIDDVISQTEGIITKCKAQTGEINILKQDINTLKKELEYYKEIELDLKKSLDKQKQDQENIKQNAIIQSESIIREAKNNSSRIVNEALLRADKIQIKTDQLESNMKIYKRKMKLLLEQQQAVYEEIEVLEL